MYRKRHSYVNRRPRPYHHYHGVPLRYNEYDLYDPYYAYYPRSITRYNPGLYDRYNIVNNPGIVYDRYNVVNNPYYLDRYF